MRIGQLFLWLSLGFSGFLASSVKPTHVNCSSVDIKFYASTHVARPSKSIQVTAIVFNQASTNAENLRLKVDLPSGATFLDSMVSPHTKHHQTPDIEGSSVIWSLSPLSHGISRRYSVTVAVDLCAPQKLDFEASVFAANSSCSVDAKPLQVSQVMNQ